MKLPNHIVAVNSVPKLRQFKWLRVLAGKTGDPYFGPKTVRPGPWSRGVCIGTGEGMALLFYNGRFMTGMHVTSPAHQQEYLLKVAGYLMHPKYRKIILKEMGYKNQR